MTGRQPPPGYPPSYPRANPRANPRSGPIHRRLAMASHPALPGATSRRGGRLGLPLLWLGQPAC